MYYLERRLARMHKQRAYSARVAAVRRALARRRRAGVSTRGGRGRAHRAPPAPLAPPSSPRRPRRAGRPRRACHRPTASAGWPGRRRIGRRTAPSPATHGCMLGCVRFPPLLHAVAAPVSPCQTLSAPVSPCHIGLQARLFDAPREAQRAAVRPARSRQHRPRWPRA